MMLCAHFPVSSVVTMGKGPLPTMCPPGELGGLRSLGFAQVLPTDVLGVGS